MKTTLFVLALIVVVVLVLAKRKRQDVESVTPNRLGAPPYFGKSPLSEPEQTLYFRLRDAFPEHIVLCQVALSALVGIRKNPSWQSQFNEISRKYVDFVLCRPDFSVAAVIELDDSSHQRGERIKADAIKDAAFKVIECPLVRLDAREMPDVSQLKQQIGH